MKYGFTYSILIIVTLLLNTSPSVAANYRFHTLSPVGGFYFDGIESICQDNEGFIWVLMDNDFLRFNGYEYKSFLPLLKQADPDLKWKINNIADDEEGNILVATNNGIYQYCPATDSFRLFLKEQVTLFRADRQGDIWTIKEGSLAKIDKKTKGTTFMLCENKRVPYTLSIECQDDTMFFCGRSADIYYRSVTDEPGRVFLFHHFPGKNQVLDIQKVNGKLWALTSEGGIYQFDIATRAIEQVYPFSGPLDKTSANLRNLYVDKNGNVWIASLNGLFVFDVPARKYTEYRHINNDRFTIPNNSIWVITEDRQKNIWLGTFSGGLCYVNLGEQLPFETYIPEDQKLNHQMVSSFADTPDDIWIGTNGGGINRLHKHSGKFTYLKRSTSINSLSSDLVKSLLTDRENRLWIATYAGGLDCYDIKEERFTHFEKNKNNPSGLLSNDLRKIVAQNDSGFWIAYQLPQTVVSFFSFHDFSCRHFIIDKTSPDYILDIAPGADNQLYVITRNNLYSLDAKTKKIRNISASHKIFSEAQTICQGPGDKLWIGTIGNGLLEYDEQRDSLFTHPEIQDLNSLSVFSLCADSIHLWMGTNKGLVRYDIAGNSCLLYDENDGIQGHAFYPLAVMKGLDNRMYFGGTNGFTIVNPRNVKANPYQPHVILSDFYINNKVVPPAFKNSSNASSPETIVLKYNQPNFGFRFSSDNYLVPQKNKFKFRLKNYEDNWTGTDAVNRVVQYVKVPPGTYFFEIMTANNDGVWNSKPTSIRIIRKASPWWNVWTKMIYSAFLLFIITVIIHYINEQRKLRLQILYDRLEKEKNEAIQEARFHFFTNVSHDLRTPVSLILASISNLRQAGIPEYYFRILSNNAHRLLNLVNELLDFRKIENNSYVVNKKPVDLNGFIRELTEDFHNFAVSKKIDFRFLPDPDLPVAYIDKPILEKIIINVLGNAFNYTPDGKTIRVEIYSDLHRFKPEFNLSHTLKKENLVETDTFAIAIRDTGIGIAEKELKHVFEHFQTGTTGNNFHHKGSGVGLSLVKELVFLHQGYLSLYSEQGKGTELVIVLPVGASSSAKLQPRTGQNGPQAGLGIEQKIPAPPPPITDDKPLNQEKATVLLVEDHHDLRILVAGFLSAYFEIREAENGEEALNILKKHMIDLIISDIMMPVKDGISLCKEVKADVNTSHIPFVLLTAKTGVENQLEGTASGADFYFEKPVDLALLLSFIRNIFNRQQKLRDYYSRNYFVDSRELSPNDQDHSFFTSLSQILDNNLKSPEIEVNSIASEMAMSRSKLYSKIKTLTGKSVVEFILNYRLRKAAQLMVSQDRSISQIMEEVGIKSQSYFTRTFKKEFGDTPSAFMAKSKKDHRNEI